MNVKYLAAALILSLVPTMASATSWQVDIGASQVNFDYTKDGASTTGKFEAFSGTGWLDPGAPDTAELVIQIDTFSIDLNDRLASIYATSAEWFDSKNHRFITYRLTKLSPRSDGQFDAQGLLSVRGETKPVTSVISLHFDGPKATASGSLKIDRSDYLLGYGPSMALVDIGSKVAVRFDLRARQAN
ncbi:MAG: YceI family protein [Pseudomonadota bacterium]